MSIVHSRRQKTPLLRGSNCEEIEDSQTNEWSSLQKDCGLSALEVMFLQDQSYTQAMRLSLRASAESFENEEQKKVAQRQFKSGFIAGLPISFEQLCCVIVRGISKQCGSCTVKRRRLYMSLCGDPGCAMGDPLFDYCPHLICSEWKHLQHLRTISRAFWQAFLESKVGRSIRFCFPYCRVCNWADMYMGSALKVHVCESTRETCPCCYERNANYLDWWSGKFMKGEPRVIVSLCRCRKSLQ